VTQQQQSTYLQQYAAEMLRFYEAWKECVKSGHIWGKFRGPFTGYVHEPDAVYFERKCQKCGVIALVPPSSVKER